MPRFALTEQRSALTEQRSALTEQRSALTEPRSALTEPRSALTEQRSALTEPRPGPGQARNGAGGPPPEPITVVLVDDHSVTREGTRQILERHGDFIVVGEADRGDTAVAVVAETRPDVVVLDIFLPGLNGVDVATQITERCPGVKVLALSAFGDPEYVEAMVAAGVAGYLLKTSRPDKLVDAVRAVHSGSLVFDVGVSPLAAGSHPEADADRAAPLTSRELEVLQLLAEGLSNQQIAGRLHISRRTVEGHLHHIFDKCGVTSRTEVLLYAMRHELVATPDPDRR